jgi:hypothetical protein
MTEGDPRIGWILMTILAGTLACTSTSAYRRPLREVDQAELKKQLPALVDVTWSDGGTSRQEPARDISIPGGVATWTHAATGEKHAVPDEALRSIEWTSHWRGAGQGFLVGGLGLATLGAAAGFASGDDPPCGGREVFFCLSSTRSEKAILGGVLGLLAGGLVGTLVGLAVGSTTHIDFVP